MPGFEWIDGEEKPYCLNHCAVAYIIPEKEEPELKQVNSRIK